LETVLWNDTPAGNNGGYRFYTSTAMPI